MKLTWYLPYVFIRQFYQDLAAYTDWLWVLHNHNPYLFWHRYKPHGLPESNIIQIAWTNTGALNNKHIEKNIRKPECNPYLICPKVWAEFLDCLTYWSRMTHTVRYWSHGTIFGFLSIGLLGTSFSDIWLKWKITYGSGHKTPAVTRQPQFRDLTHIHESRQKSRRYCIGQHLINWSYEIAIQSLCTQWYVSIHRSVTSYR